MNPLEQFVDGALAWLWQTSLAAAVLAAGVLLLQLAFGRWLGPRWTYFLWLLVIARLVLPFAPESKTSFFNLHAASQPPVVETVSVSTEPIAPPAGMRLPSVAPSRVSLSTIVVAAWLLGALGYVVACFMQYRRMQAWARRQPPVLDPRIVAALRAMQKLLGFHRPLPILLQTKCTSVPALLGIWRPYLLLPKKLLETWTDEELKLAILHELVHVRRRDNLLNWLLILVQALHWCNPLVWLILRRLRAEREILCDAIVLSHLTPERRRDYGATLIKAAAEIGPPRFAPGLVPIVNHKQEIQRRIRMIARFKPTPRAVSILATGFVLGLACVTFTGAARKEKTAPPATDAKKGNQASSQERAVKGINALEEEWQKLDSQLRQREAELDKMRQELRIPDYIAEADGKGPSGGAETLRTLEQLRIEAQAEIQRIDTLRTHLSGMTREDRRRAVTVAQGDEQVSVLLNQLATAEQKLAVVSEDYAAEHPEVRVAKRMVVLITKQVDDRIEGILEGLKVKLAAQRSQLDFVARELESVKHGEVEARLKYRPYFQAKRDLQSLLMVRERMTQRLIQEKVDLAMPPKAKASDAAPATP